MLVTKKGEHLGIYNIGTMEEVTIKRVAMEVASYFEKEVIIVPGKLAEGGPLHRCPDISKLKKLGFTPQISFNQGLKRTVDWYNKNSDKKPKQK